MCVQSIGSHSDLNVMLQRSGLQNRDTSVKHTLDHQTDMDIEKFLLAFLKEVCNFIQEDDERNPIKNFKFTCRL